MDNQDYKILITFSFTGTNYGGYQVQPGIPTVQGELNRAARELFGYECDIVGCSRTDSGVHANMFCATVAKKGENRIVTAIDTRKIPIAMTMHLPEDIAVYDTVEVPCDFHARYNVKSKEYVYRIYNRRIRSPFENGRAWHIPKYLDAELMNKAAQGYIGKHDFRSFMTVGTPIENTVRTVFEANVTRRGDIVEFRVKADGFLYNMVRIMTGTLVGIALGQFDSDCIPEMLESLDRRSAGMTAPAEGLYLNKVIY